MKKSTFYTACISLVTFGLLFVKPGMAQTLTIDPADIAAVWLFDDGSGDILTDSGGQATDGTIEGATWTTGARGGGLRFDGVDDIVRIPDSDLINVTNGPWTDRTITAIFKVDVASIADRKQVIFEEGGRTRGIVIYVHGGNVYVGAWNRAEYNWDGAWPSVPIQSDVWYHVGLVIRDGGNVVEPDKFEMWFNGEKVASEPGGQMFNHGDDIGIGGTSTNVVFHDDDGSGTDRDWFAGVIDEIRIFNASPSAAELTAFVVSVEPRGKLTTMWGEIKASR